MGVKPDQLNAVRAGAAFPLLASSIRLAGLEIPNRLAIATMSSVLGSDTGEVTPELITVEFSCVDGRYGRAEAKQLLIDDDTTITGRHCLVEVIRNTGARAAIQLHAPGQFAEKSTLAGRPAGPSAQYSRRDATKQLCRALEGDEISGLVESYAQAAPRSIAAGYEAIEIHGAHGNLPMALLSPLKNLRDDEWGGDEERRLRFALEIIRAIKAELGAERPLIYRLPSSDFLPGGLTLEDMVHIAPRLVEAGADAIHVSSGTLDRAVDPMSMTEGWRFEHGRAIKAAVAVPVMAVGPVCWPQTAEAALATGARATQFPIPGVDGPNVLSAYDLLMGEVEIQPSDSAPVIVYGGGETGCETAEYLAEKGCHVVFVTRSAGGMYRKHLIARLNNNSRIEIREKCTIVAIGSGSVRVSDPAGEYEIAASQVVLAQGRQSGSDLTDVLEAARIPFILVGDVENIGRIGDAVHAARRAALELSAQMPLPETLNIT